MALAGMADFRHAGLLGLRKHAPRRLAPMCIILCSDSSTLMNLMRLRDGARCLTRSEST